MKWEQIAFGELYSIPSRNGVSRPRKVRGSGYKMINMGELFAFDRVNDIPMERVPLNEKELAAMCVEYGDLLFARQSLVLEGAGKVSIVMNTTEPTTFESHLIRVRLDSRKADPFYYFYFFRSPYSKIPSIVQQCAQAGIRGTDLKKILVPNPPLEIQKAIAERLKVYDDLIENNRRRIELLEQAARLLYKEWFVHFRFPGHEQVKIVDGVPEGWRETTISGVCETLGGGTPSTKNSHYWEDGDITWVTPTDVTRNKCLILLDSDKKITQAGFRNSSAKMLPPKTILMTSRASVGYFALIDKQVCTNQGFINIIPLKDHMRMYLLHNLIYRVEEIRSVSSGSTYKEISKGRFREMPIIVPSNKLLRMFEDQVSIILQQVHLLCKLNARLAIARDLLLPRLMNGEIAL